MGHKAPKKAALAKAEPPPFPIEAVVRIGDGGRGFILEVAESCRYVVTAAHCLPAERLPTPHLANGIRELTFPEFIGSLAKRAKQTIWGELCVFSLTDDVAAFREPDGQELYKQAAEYGEFIDAVAFKIGAPPPLVPPYKWKTVPGTPAWVLSLDCTWMPCTVHTNGRFLTTRGTKIESGMSGSPILNANGAAIGLISTSAGLTGYDGFGDDRHPSLVDCLPPWLLRSGGEG
jgi:hypothetical protein